MDEIKKILNELSTQLDGVESYLRRLNDIGRRPEFLGKRNELGQILRVRTMVAMEVSLDELRNDVQIIEDKMASM